MNTPTASLRSLLRCVLLAAAAMVVIAGLSACSGDSEQVVTAAEPDEPIPVEPDGGIGDGAEPLPGADEPVDEGTWHGPQVAMTNCPGMEWRVVQASAFSFSLPADFTEDVLEGVDSEVGFWSRGDEIKVSFDYGWYSGSIATMPGAEAEPIDYSGIAGQQTIIRDADATSVEAFFEQVQEVGGQWDRLGLVVTAVDPADEIIGRCIVGSIEWNF